MRLPDILVMSGPLAWLGRVPTSDPLERRSAVTIQLFCLGLSVLLVVSEVISMKDRLWLRGTGAAYGVFADWATVVASLTGVWLIRRGRIRPGFETILGSYLAILAGSLLLRGLSYHEHILVRVYWVLLVLPALLLGRRALWASLALLLTAMFLGHVRDLGYLGGGGPLSPPIPSLGIWGQAVAVLLLLCLILDHFGTTLRQAYSAARAGQETAEVAAAELRAANRRLEAEMSQRAKAETLLFQSQKLEAIGRLSGGVAHDFNNVLTVIFGFAEFAQGRLAERDPVQADLHQILEAARRAGALTRQLLAFASRQVFEPQTVLVEDRIRAVEPMLRRLIGEQITILLRLSATPWTVCMDPNQLEQVLVNLAVNARDAMPDGGTLTLQTDHQRVEDFDPRLASDLSAGEYVRLRVIDSGQGMDDAVLANIFEPFFTTKDLGKGTGLGLATCYGIIRQAGGAIAASSVPGQGSVFEILLPRGTAPTEIAMPLAVGAPSKGVETILVVEDDGQILDVATRLLRDRGYTVLGARNAGAAEALAQSYPGEIALLLTDVVMPGGNGHQLASVLGRARPRLRVLFTSGYSQDIVEHHGVLNPGVRLLTKPFTPELLAKKVRDVLDERSTPS